MGLVYFVRKRLGRGTHLTVSTGGASVSQRIGKRLTVNSRGRASLRLLPGLSFRFRLW